MESVIDPLINCGSLDSKEMGYSQILLNLFFKGLTIQKNALAQNALCFLEICFPHTKPIRNNYVVWQLYNILDA